MKSRNDSTLIKISNECYEHFEFRLSKTLQVQTQLAIYPKHKINSFAIFTTIST